MPKKSKKIVSQYDGLLNTYKTLLKEAQEADLTDRVKAHEIEIKRLEKLKKDEKDHFDNDKAKPIKGPKTSDINEEAYEDYKGEWDVNNR